MTPHTPTPVPIRTPPFVVVNVEPSPGSIYLGAFSNPTQTSPPPPAALTTLETNIGRKVALTLHYYGWTDKFPGTLEVDDAENGRMPVDAWNCGVPDAVVAAGSQDTIIRRRADALKAFGKPIMLRFMWEMNLASNPSFRRTCYDAATDDANGVFSPAQFVAAWNHIHQIFVDEGATNVVFVWNPSGSSNATAYYPGANTVDWVAMDQYDRGNQTFVNTYAAPYAWLAPFQKPILIGETGAPASLQANFFTGAAAVLATTYPLVKGYIYFDAGPLWSLTTAGTAGFTTFANDPYLSAAAP